MLFVSALFSIKSAHFTSGCVSQLALTHSPPLSEIFVFTDASPKDAHLFDAVKALTLEKQSRVSLEFKPMFKAPTETNLRSLGYTDLM